MDERGLKFNTFKITFIYVLYAPVKKEVSEN